MEKKEKRAKVEFKETFVRLLAKHSSRKISVSLLCEKAGYNRSTFYEYYPSMDELLKDVLKDQLKSVWVQNDLLLDAYYLKSETGPEKIYQYLTNFFSNDVLLTLISSNDSAYFRHLIIQIETSYEINKYHIYKEEDKIKIIYRNTGIFSIIFRYIGNEFSCDIKTLSNIVFDLIKNG